MKRAAVSVLFALLAASALQAGDVLEKVHPAPALAFIVPGMGQESLAGYRGKVVALEFIFTTCPHCQAATQLMSKLQTEYGPKGLQVIDVAVNQNADLLVENFSRDFHVNFPVGWTTMAQMEKFMGFDERFVVPQLVLIDRKGEIHWQTPALSNDGTWEKLMTETAIRQHIEELLNSNGAASAHLASARK